jgi:tripartite-type tricarboxylate transporter receptor subunit TctC
MKSIHRRKFLHLGAAAAAVPALYGAARAQSYPAKPLRWIVGFPPGGGADTVTRIVALWLADRLGQPVIVENKPGASTNISIQTVAAAPPDGYTLLFVAASAAVNFTLFDKLPFNLVRDIAPVSGLVDFPLVMVAHPSLPAKTVAELVAHAKANPGGITLASFGTGTTSHVAGELFKMMTGINMVHVPYRGGAPMIADLVGGQVQVAFDVMTTALPHVRSGAIRALGLAGHQRYHALPEVPTIRESVPGYEANSWCGVGVPKGTPAEVIDRLNREINAGLAEPALKARLAEVATTPILFAPGEFGAYVAAEVEKWAKVVRLAGVKAE